MLRDVTVWYFFNFSTMTAKLVKKRREIKIKEKYRKEIF